MIGRYRIGYALLLGIVLMCVSASMASAQSTNVLPQIYLPSIRVPPPPPLEIAFVSDRDGNNEIYVMSADGGRQIRLTNHPARDSRPAWSPDGTKISFLRESVDSDGHTHGYTYYVMNADGSNQRALMGTDEPVWSPDGSKIAVVSKEVVPGTTDARTWIYVMDADGGTETLLTQGDSPTWSPDGDRIAFVFGDQIYVIHVDGSNQAQLTDSLGSDHTPAWSPDGSRIAFVSDRDGNNEIYLMNADGGNQIRLTDDPVSNGSPLWSPDGNKIAFQRYERYQHPYEAIGLSIGTMNADGSGQFIINGIDPQWSPDGNKILGMSSVRMGRYFYIMDQRAHLNRNLRL